jgi:hypothetical protein
MIDPPPEDERPDADAMFQRTLGNLVNTPHKPHVKLADTESPETGKKRGRPKTAPKSASEA